VVKLVNTQGCSRAGAPERTTPSPKLSAEDALDAAAAAAAAVRVHGLAVAWTPHAVFYLRAWPADWEAVAAVLEQGGRGGACGGALLGSPGGGPGEAHGGTRGGDLGAGRGAPTEKITHGAKEQLKALASVCSSEAGRCLALLTVHPLDVPLVMLQ